jgi:hypothetical protein
MLSNCCHGPSVKWCEGRLMRARGARSHTVATTRGCCTNPLLSGRTRAAEFPSQPVGSMGPNAIHDRALMCRRAVQPQGRKSGARRSAPPGVLSKPLAGLASRPACAIQRSLACWDSHCLGAREWPPGPASRHAQQRLLDRRTLLVPLHPPPRRVRHNGFSLYFLPSPRSSRSRRRGPRRFPTLAIPN